MIFTDKCGKFARFSLTLELCLKYIFSHIRSCFFLEGGAIFFSIFSLWTLKFREGSLTALPYIDTPFTRLLHTDIQSSEQINPCLWTRPRRWRGSWPPQPGSWGPPPPPPRAAPCACPPCSSRCGRPRPCRSRRPGPIRGEYWVTWPGLRQWELTLSAARAGSTLSVTWRRYPSMLSSHCTRLILLLSHSDWSSGEIMVLQCKVKSKSMRPWLATEVRQTIWRGGTTQHLWYTWHYISAVTQCSAGSAGYGVWW